MLKNIGEGLISVAFYTAISTMCSHCEAILSALQQAMQDMNALTKGTCQAGAGINLNGVAKSIGSAIGNDAKDLVGFNGTDTGTTSAETNNTESPGKAMDQVGSQIKTIGEDTWSSLEAAVGYDSNTKTTGGGGTVTAATNSSATPGSQSAPHSALGEISGVGNNTWNALRSSKAQELLSGVGIPLGQNNSTITMELIMSILGTRIEVPPGVRGGISSAANAAVGTPSSNNKPDGQDATPTLAVGDLLSASPSELNKKFIYTCQSVSGNGETYPAFGLASGDVNVNDSCLVLNKSTLASQNIISVQSYVQSMLFGGTINGISHAGIYSTVTSGDAMSAKQKAFLNDTGIPIYAIALKFNNIDRPHVGPLLTQAEPIIVATYSIKLLLALRTVLPDTFSEDSKAVVPKDLGTIMDTTIPSDIHFYTVISNKAVHFLNSNSRLLRTCVADQNSRVQPN